jgi:murein DD-endopeptidase MepM/ murein hydrolase activator NlpD
VTRLLGDNAHGLSRALLLALVLAAGAMSVVSAGAARPPGSSASSWAVRVVVAGAAGASTATVTSPPATGPASSAGFSWPADGSVIATGATMASSSTQVGQNAVGAAASTVAHVSIFGGEITADTVSAQVSAQTTGKAAEGSFDGSEVVNLRAFGKRVGASRLALGDWGYLTIDSRGVDTSAPQGAVGYRGFETELDLHLNMSHDGLPAGSEIQVGYAEAAAQTAPASVKPVPLPLAPGNPLPGDRPQLLPKQTGQPAGVPQTVTPPITAGPYDFPVYGKSSFIDTFGAYRADTGYHHGDDIFGELGQPLLAVANGTLFSVGWNPDGGNRIWLRDAQGNEFYYAHLSAFSSLAVNGARVKAGEVIGFMGDTGDAEGTPTHLHFEVHPVSLLYLGYDGAVDPTSYLESWHRPSSVPFPVVAGWAPTIPGTIEAPDPGAMLLQDSDISSADGLDPGSVRRAFG